FSLESGTSKDNSVTKEFTAELSPKILPGTYSIVGKAYYDYNVLDDQDGVNLVVKECAPAKTTSTTVPNTSANVSKNTSTTVGGTLTSTPATKSESANAGVNTGVTTAQPVTNQLSSAVIIQSVEKLYGADDYLFGALVVSIVVVFILITLLLISLFR
ncbi:hypothetical protein HZC32_03640, partial [Candidatus Woesearchaeota archaeon]|nr:hypothetical protein [Candidatus Woesearchaeota archaeon]